MINKSQIENTLDRIGKLYLTHLSDYQSTYFAKLAIIESCGWIEESIDNIVLETANKKLKNPDNLIALQKLTQDNHSFRYDPHFRRLLSQLLGFMAIERLDKSYDNLTDSSLKDKLTKILCFNLPVDANKFASYNPEIKESFTRVFGKVSIEELERLLDHTKFTVMCSALVRLKISRDDLAHTYLKGTLASVNAPSVTNQLFKDVYLGLKDIEVCVRKFPNV
jgi:hypothetical protein